MQRFDQIMETVLEREGGYVNNPLDKGGPTKFGITHKALAAWRGTASVTPAEVEALTVAEAVTIYRHRFWGEIRGDNLPQPVDFVVMDGAVNHGVGTMVGFLQVAVGAANTGKLTDQDVATIAMKTDSPTKAVDLAIALAEARKQRYLAHEDAPHFINGWRNRLNAVMAAALAPFPTTWTFDGGRVDLPAGANQQPPIAVEPAPVSGLMGSAISDEALQQGLADAGFYHDEIDGIFGKNSVAAMDAFLDKRTAEVATGWQNWLPPQRKIALGQLLCKDLNINPGRIDGLFGDNTRNAFVAFNRAKAGLPPETWRDAMDDAAAAEPPAPAVANNWPRQADVETFFGVHCAPPFKRLDLPFKMKIAWDLKKEIGGFMVHEKVHDSAKRVFDKVWAHYGQEGIEEIGVNLFGGCYNCRPMKGGTKWSMHSWAIAIDFDPERNQLKWSKKHARLAAPDAEKFWEFWEEEGWLSLGRARDFDWMHVQAARL